MIVDDDDSSDDESHLPQVCIPLDTSSHQKRPRVPSKQKEKYKNIKFSFRDEEEEDKIFDFEVPGAADDSDGEMDDDFWDGGEGVIWEFKEDDVDDGDNSDEETCNILERGVLVHKPLRKHLINVSPSDPLFEGSPYSARDFCRYLIVVRHATGQ
jgi:hypothetical protein